MNNKYVFFWTGPFSQWHRCKFTNEYGEFNCAEQYMMYRKALFFDNIDIAKKILQTEHPKDQKILGREIKNFKPELWDKISKDIVHHGNFCKFTQNLDLLERLLETKDKLLVEASPNDTIWGIGMAEDHPDILDQTKWKGKNQLGNILTNLRNQLLLIFEE